MVSVEEVIRSTIVKCLLYLLGMCWNEKRSLIQAEQTHGLQLPLGLIRNANNANTLFANKLFLRVIETHISNPLLVVFIGLHDPSYRKHKQGI